MPVHWLPFFYIPPGSLFFTSARDAAGGGDADAEPNREQHTHGAHTAAGAPLAAQHPRQPPGHTVLKRYRAATRDTPGCVPGGINSAQQTLNNPQLPPYQYDTQLGLREMANSRF